MKVDTLQHSTGQLVDRIEKSKMPSTAGIYDQVRQREAQAAASGNADKPFKLTPEMDATTAAFAKASEEAMRSAGVSAPETFQELCKELSGVMLEFAGDRHAKWVRAGLLGFGIVLVAGPPLAKALAPFLKTARGQE